MVIIFQPSEVNSASLAASRRLLPRTGVPVYFIHPPVGAGFGHHEVAATIMAVIETAMHENNSFVFGQHHIGAAGQFFVVEPIPETVRVEKLADDEFGFGVFAAHPAHVEAARSGVPAGRGCVRRP